eukprot:416557_1
MAKKITIENSFRLATNNLMPKVGLGTWKLSPDIAEGIIYSAIKQGYNLIDCAANYGNEKEIGKALKKTIKDEKYTNRNDLFITSKLWNTDHNPKDVKPALQRTLNDLNIDYLDLYLMHFPVSWPNRRTNENDYPEKFNNDFYGMQTKTTVFQTWEAMEQLIEDGLVKDIGVSNFSTSLIWELDKQAKKPISVNQVELHPFLAQNALVNLCESKDIQMTAYSSLASLSYENWGIYKSLPSLLETQEIKDMSKKYNVTEAQILLAWAVNTRNVSVIPKTNKIDRLKENLECTHIVLDEDDVHIIDNFDRGLRFNDHTLTWGISIF